MNQAKSQSKLVTTPEQTPPAIRLSGVGKSFANGERADRGAEGCQSHGSAAGDRRLDRRVRLGQEHVAQYHLRICEARPRPGLYLRRGSEEFNDWCSVSYMFQDDRLLPWRTAIRNVEFALEAGSIGKKRARPTRARSAAAGGVGGLRRSISLPAFRRHAQPRGARAQPGDRAAHSADGRTVFPARRANARARCIKSCCVFTSSSG